MGISPTKIRKDIWFPVSYTEFGTMTSLNHTFDGNCVNLLIEVTVTNPNIGLLCYPVYSEAIKKQSA